VANRGSSSPEDRYARALRALEAYRRRQSEGTAEPVADFLAAHEDQREILEALLEDRTPTRRHADPEPARAPLPDRVGPYKILAELGEGGMGTVYAAEQKEPVRRRVALKLIKQGMDSKAVLARFGLERQALAVMSHDAIAKIHDAGTTERGQPYFAMELFEGVPITRYCDEHKLDLRARIALFQQVCQGVQHAHQKGVIHRDLKPGNVLCALRGGQHVVKIIDFGVARATDHQLVQQTIFTDHGILVGTPEYMSPEQAGGNPLAIDTRTDVYSLGVLLYELLAGALPFESRELRAAGLLEMQRRIREDEPPKPSTKITTLGEGASGFARVRNTSLAGLAKALRGDLDWIVLKAIAKEPERRYESANGLEQDLARHLLHEPVLAGPPTATYRLRKFARKYRGPLIGTGGVLVTAMIGTFVAIQYARTATARNRDFEQLSAVVRYERAVTTVESLYPPWPYQIDAMERWLGDCDRLLEMRPDIERTVTTVQRVLVSEQGDSRPARKTTMDEAAYFLHVELNQLLEKLGRLENSEKRAIEQRLHWARQIEYLSIIRHRARWDDAQASIAASERYPSPIDLQPLMGLVPIGMNPATKLWEFYDLLSAWDGKSDPASIPIPTHDQKGNIEVTGETGIVFVLLPGGTFTIGAQKNDASGPNYDEQAEGDERLFEVDLAPFFLARHEMTQGQWQRLAGSTPSEYAAGQTGPPGVAITKANPVEQISWEDCNRWLPRFGLELPTDAQWEYACRAGSTTPWSCAVADLRYHANVADATAKGTAWAQGAEKWADGHLVHAPVATFRPNAFGLFDVHGNVWEWTRDGYFPSHPPRVGDGFRETKEASPDRLLRGGSFSSPASAARSSNLEGMTPSFQAHNIGVRAARFIQSSRIRHR
jgi:serine/threonine protein kinase/formylglycine-generating enzyme required for sulfatase activity